MKTIIILGGSGGIGSEIVKILLKNGYYVINIDKTKWFLNNNNYKNIVVDLEQININSLINNLTSAHTVYAFVSCIGIYLTKKLDTFNWDDYYRTQKINVEIPIEFSLRLIDNMRQNNNGKLIYISSAAAYIGSRDISYSVSKSAIIGFMKGLCKNLKLSNIYAYCIAPGIVDTQMSQNMNTSRQNDAILNTLNNRKCHPYEVAKLCYYLIKEDEGYQNGSVIHINNGLYMN